MSRFEISPIGWCWQLKDEKEDIVAAGGQSFSSKDNVRESIQNIYKRVKLDTPITSKDSIQDGSSNTRFTYFCANGRYHWNLQNEGNNEEIAKSVIDYPSEERVISAIKYVRHVILSHPPSVLEDKEKQEHKKGEEGGTPEKEKGGTPEKEEGGIPEWVKVVGGLAFLYWLLK